VKANVRKNPDYPNIIWEAMEAEFEQNVRDDIWTKLSQGSRLTKPERMFLLKRLKEFSAKKHPRGRPPAAAADIAQMCHDYECFGIPTKVAVANTAEFFRVSRSLVYAARRRLLSE
jgi:hypothetical protein